MRKELDKIYNPKEVENKIYDFWLEGKYFSAKVDKNKKPYTIVMPPPNITGHLHMGHALDCTIQDILIRFKRMQGYSALWLPGTDHASIATEAKIVEKMKEEGISKDDIGREGFLERAWEWKQEYGDFILKQLRYIGSSCDWDKLRFTLDEGCSEAVKEVFVRLYNKGLIYRGERIISWCPHCKTSISDAEVEFEEKAGHFWHIKYPVKGEENTFIEIATTRPETLLGDTAVAVNPDDERYKHLIGKTLILPLVGREIPIIADSYVELEFGTGAVKITPAHDPNDFEVGARHNLPIINVMNDDGSINENGGEYVGLDRYVARKKIVEDLEKQKLLVNIKDHSHNVGSCYRCGTTIEPRISMQWFVKMDELAEPAIKAVKEGETKFIPSRFDKTYFNWMENIRDWCISRQLWWGHRIPAYYCQDCGEMVISKDHVDVCPKCSSKNIRQDEDTLDTWFSSALWPFSTLGWPEKTPELEYFYPTDTLVTAYDIIFFWVARMIFSGIENMNEVPFKTVFIHGLIRDENGKKMSKSSGNGIDPIEMIDKYGADALRFAVVTGNSPGNDMRFSEKNILSSRNFCNKIWNAARFILMNLEEGFELDLPDTLEIEDKWILSKYNTLVKEVTENIDKYEIGVAIQKLYIFIWDVFCDWYIELSKPRLQLSGKDLGSVQQILVYIMTGVLKLLHPFMPFITEEIYSALPHEEESIMVSKWPEYNQQLVFSEEEKDFEKIVEAIKGIRNQRAKMNVPPSKKTRIAIETEDQDIFLSTKIFFERLAYASEVDISSQVNMDSAVTVVTNSARIFIPMDELVDKEKEIARLEKEKALCENDIKIISSKLNNSGFMAKAPEKVIQSENEKLKNATEKLKKIEESLSSFN